MKTERVLLLTVILILVLGFTNAQVPKVPVTIERMEALEEVVSKLVNLAQSRSTTLNNLTELGLTTADSLEITRIRMDNLSSRIDYLDTEIRELQEKVERLVIIP